MSEDVTNLKGDLLRLSSEQPSKLRGDLLKNVTEKPKPTGFIHEGKLITKVRQRDGGALFRISEPHESPLGTGTEKKLIVQLTEIEPPKDQLPRKIAINLDNLQNRIQEDNPPWIIVSSEENK